MSKYKFESDGSDIGFGEGKIVDQSITKSDATKKNKNTTTKTFNQLVKSLYRSTMMAQQKVEELCSLLTLLNSFYEWRCDSCFCQP